MTPTTQSLEQLAERLENKAVKLLEAYLTAEDRNSAWDGEDRLSSAEHLLRCAAALRTQQEVPNDGR